MAELECIAPGERVRCLAEDLNEGPRYGWVGTVLKVEREHGLFVVSIAWDALRGNRAERRKNGVPIHVWGFQSAELAAEFLEVVAIGFHENG